MGKSLIIKGADFSANAIENTITWYSENWNDTIHSNYTYTGTKTLPKWSGVGIANQEIIGKSVNCVRFGFKPDSILPDNHYAIFRVSAPTIGAVATVELVKEFTLSTEEIANGRKIVTLESTLTIGETDTLFVGYNASVSSGNKPYIPVGAAVYFKSDKPGVVIKSSDGTLVVSASVSPCMDFGLTE